MNKTIDIEVDETYDLSNFIKDNDPIFIGDFHLIQIENKILKGIKEGKTFFKINQDEYHINVLKPHSLSDSFTLSYERLSNKKLLVLGDSVSAQATIQQQKTYSTLLKEACHLKEVYNAAIGGTTLTYMYSGSNIDKEYHLNENAIDGCRVIKKLEKENKIKDFDYVIIAFGHNDQYFQPAIDENNNKKELTIEDCHSFKNSYRFILQTLKKNQPFIRIVLLNCTYSEYDKVSPSPYGNKYNYASYRKATQEIAKEFKVKYLDPWDYMKPFKDYDTTQYYYQDSVHLSANGHVELFKFLLNQ